jgi:hypothetical protein
MSNPETIMSKPPINRALFFEAAGELMDETRYLVDQVDAALCWAENLLCPRRDRLSNQDDFEEDDSQEELPSDFPSPSIHTLLRRMTGPMMDVMDAFDRLCWVAGCAPPFKLALELFAASRSVRGKIARLLDDNPP